MEHGLSPERDAALIGRRRLLKAAFAVGAAGVVGVGCGSAVGGAPVSPSSTGATTGTTSAVGLTGSAATAPSSASPTTTTTTAATTTGPTGLVHPGLLHTQADLDRMAAKVAAGAQPWAAGWDRLTANPHARSTWRASPQATVYRGSGHPENYAKLYNDIHAAYQNALRWRITGDTQHGDAARDILNAWSATLKTIDGSADRYIAAGVYGYQFANAAELMRDYPGFELARFQNMMLGVFYPLNNRFLIEHNDAYITNYWASWDQLTYASVLAIGILCDDRGKVDQAIEYFKTGAGMGSIRNAVPVLHPGGLGQWVESGRDQGHATLGIGLTAAFCEMAHNQGFDMYGYDDNRFLAGAEYAAKYNLGQDVPYAPFTWKKGTPNGWSGQETFTAASPNARGNVRPVWEMIYHHYVGRKGLSAPNVAAMAAQHRAEGGGGDYGPNSGGFDQLGFGTLAYTR
ncbi:alginate lyase family protein [Saccharothrix deserti]|uniref:alginate lyase family protein n=1 Tax=Saccharothrix deserti TaxID=2593674 RepID=UPI00131D59B7|nr:alginate lyase family protein [Saccharothrix deserti]